MVNNNIIMSSYKILCNVPKKDLPINATIMYRYLNIRNLPQDSILNFVIIVLCVPIIANDQKHEQLCDSSRSIITILF